MSDHVDFLFVLFTPEFETPLVSLCRESGFGYRVVNDPKQLPKILESERHKVIFIEMNETQAFGLQWLEWLRTQNLDSEIGILFSRSYDESVKKSLALGVEHFVHEQSLACKAALQQSLNRALQNFVFKTKQSHVDFTLDDGKTLRWVAASAQSRLWLGDVLNACEHQAFVFLHGAKGVGKSHLVKCLQAKAQIQDAVIWDAAQTQAYEQKDVFLQVAQRFSEQSRQAWVIEEIGSLDLELQELVAEMLLGQGWLLPSGRIWPLLQIFVTSSQSVDELYEQGVLRRDLHDLFAKRGFYVPSLCNRRDDIVALANTFAFEFSNGKKRISQDVIEIFTRYTWPGEVLELQTLVQTWCNGHKHDVFVPQDLPRELLAEHFDAATDDESGILDLPYQEAKKRALHKFNKAYMKHLLDEADQNYTVAAEKAGMDRSNFKKLLKKV